MLNETAKNLKLRNSLLLMFTALIWGFSFVAQAVGGKSIGVFSFNCLRSLMGSAVLLPIIHVLDRSGHGHPPKTAKEKRTLILGGVTCGCVMAAATTLQQMGINMGTEVGKAGFLTTCYILIVPIIGLFLHKKCGWNIWVGVALAVFGLYLLCVKNGFSLQTSDLLVMICSLCFAVHIVIIDHLAPLVDGARLSQLQFLICGLILLPFMFFIDMKAGAGLASWAAPFTEFETWIPLLYAGVLNCGIAFTLQIIGQNGLNPTLASMLMSLESVFSTFAGWLILGQSLSARELSGCAVIFAAIILAQLPLSKANA